MILLLKQVLYFGLFVYLWKKYLRFIKFSVGMKHDQTIQIMATLQINFHYTVR